MAATRESSPGIDVAARLEALARSLPDSLAERERHAAAIRALNGASARVEEELASLDEEILVAGEAGLGGDQRRELEAETTAALERLGRRRGEPLVGREAETARERLIRRALRKRLGLPVLSLFSPEAERGETGAE